MLRTSSSLDYVELIMTIEDCLGIQLTDSEWEGLPLIYLRSIPVTDFMIAAHSMIALKTNQLRKEDRSFHERSLFILLVAEAALDIENIAKSIHKSN